MLVIQQNCDKEYECTVLVLEVEPDLNAEIICIQKLFFSNQNILYSRYKLY